MNLSKFLPKKKNTQDLPVDPASDASSEEERIVAEDLQARVDEENNTPKVAIEPVKERVVKVNRTIIAGAILAVCATTALFVFNPFSSSTPQQETKAPTVKTNKTEQSSALADLEKAEADKSKNPVNTQKKMNQTVKDGSVHSSAGSRSQAEDRSYSSSSRQTRVYSSPSRQSQLTEEEKEAAADRKAAKAKAQQEAETREAENRAGVRSDIFFSLPDKSSTGTGKKTDAPSVSVNDYYNNSYNSKSVEEYVQVVGDRPARNRRS